MSINGVQFKNSLCVEEQNWIKCITHSSIEIFIASIRGAYGGHYYNAFKQQKR